MSKALTWDDLAKLYGDRTGGRARIQPMDKIFTWALTQDDIVENEDGTISLVKIDEVLDTYDTSEIQDYLTKRIEQDDE